MITAPLNDTECLELLHAEVRRRAAHPAYIELAQAFNSTDEIAAFLRTRPLELDLGDPNDGPRIPCVPSQRFRHLPHTNNCLEGTGDYMTLAEIIDPSTPRTSCTIRLGNGYHTFPVELGRPVILDPDPLPRNAIDAGIYTCERRNGTRPSIVQAGESRSWLLRVATHAAHTLAEREAVRTALRAVNRTLYRGEPLAELHALATTIALAETEAPLWGDEGLEALAHGAHSFRNLLQSAELGSLVGLGKRIGERALEAYIVSQTGPVGLAVLQELKNPPSSDAPAQPAPDKEAAKTDEALERARAARTEDPLTRMSL